MSTDTEKDWLQIGVKVNTPHGIQTVTRITEDDGVHVTCGIYCRTELSQVLETFVPVVGEEYEVESDSVGGYKPAFYVGVSADGSHVFDVEGKWLWRLDTTMNVRPLKAEREKIKEWVESKIDCVESFEMDQAILITQLLDLGCLVIPETK